MSRDQGMRRYNEAGCQMTEVHCLVYGLRRRVNVGRPRKNWTAAQYVCRVYAEENGHRQSKYIYTFLLIMQWRKCEEMLLYLPF
jgi:hypothetical protein